MRWHSGDTQSEGHQVDWMNINVAIKGGHCYFSLQQRGVTGSKLTTGDILFIMYVDATQNWEI